MSDSLKDDLAAAVRGVAKEWKQAKRQADRDDRVSSRSLGRMRTWHEPKVTIRRAAFEVMERAYQHASSNGRYYANARQIMYAARPLVLELTGGEIWKNRAYFTQTLLKDYLEMHGGAWKVVWDARGHITEPHTSKVVGLGGVEVGEYMRGWTNGAIDTQPHTDPPERLATIGPHFRFGAVLFIEKEGFTEILDDAGLATRYDMAIMSTKGIPVGAACSLAQRFNTAGVRVLVMRDFDADGFKIVNTLRRGTRLAPGAEVTDIGLRLGDVAGLESEPVDYTRQSDPRHYLRRCGATKDECDFLVQGHGYSGWNGQRVELNAMTSEQLIAWLESKLNALNVSKLVPDAAALKRAYLRAVFLKAVEAATEKIIDEVKAREFEVPDDLESRLRAVWESDNTMSWDEAIWSVAGDEEGQAGSVSDYVR